VLTGKEKGIEIRRPLTDIEKEEVKKKKEELIWEKVGFRNMIKAIYQSKLPIVGHNCFYDFLFLYSAFEDIPPETIFDYKSSLGSLFVDIYDTKYIAS